MRQVASDSPTAWMGMDRRATVWSGMSAAAESKSDDVAPLSRSVQQQRGVDAGADARFRGTGRDGLEDGS
ncbi:hypothetical protein [Streptomyces sp. NPDC102437]|uniref:hypothetical protein n=1 Tax=Streptomyces sp. NPDC102437 TaxID=3366175 RepID=UPI00381DFB22